MGHSTVHLLNTSVLHVHPTQNHWRTQTVIYVRSSFFHFLAGVQLHEDNSASPQHHKWCLEDVEQSYEVVVQQFFWNLLLIPTFTCWEWLIPLAVFPTHQQRAAVQVLPRGLTAESEEAVRKNDVAVLWQPFDHYLSVCRWDVAGRSWERTRVGEGMTFL